MTGDYKFEELLVCPETKLTLKRADQATLNQINQRIEKRELKTKGGAVVEQQVTDGLVRDDHKVIYPIRDGIPIMLIEEGIMLSI